MTHAELVARACRWLSNTKRCALVFAEAGQNVCAEHPDALGFRGGGVVSHVVECKVSRSDFFADARKPVHKMRLGKRMGMHRWYLVPTGLVTVDDLPPGWGLLYAEPRAIRVVLDAPPHYDETRDLRSELTWLYSATRRHQIGVEWRAKAFRFAPVSEEQKEPRG